MRDRFAPASIVAALLSAAILLAGCGSGHHSSSANTQPLCPNGQTKCVSVSPRAKVKGPQGLAANLTWLIPQSQPFLKNLRVSCPAAHAYPITCRLQAIDSRKRKKLIGGDRPVTGTITVIGVFTVTHTYAYSLLFGQHS